ncbi:MAG: hypothetical protein FWD73_10695 [Polyangiaceae bacterium]|nr:hypothetical protein [Polyangiaceae bacterium]
MRFRSNLSAMKRYARGTLPAICVLAGVLASTAARADTPAQQGGSPAASPDASADARMQYHLGTQAFQAKRYKDAALHFETAAALRPSAVALYTAGMAWDLASRPERAADAYVRAKAMSGLDSKQSSVAVERVAQLERTLGTVVVTAPAGWRVQLDAFTEVPTPARLHGAPGVHVLSIREPGDVIELRDVSLEAGKVVNLELGEKPKPAVVEVPPKVEHVAPEYHQPGFWNARRGVGAIIAGAGVAALGGGAVLGLQANKARDAYNAGPTRQSYDHASSMQTWTNVAFIAGGVLLAGGVVLVVWPRSEKGGAQQPAKLSVAPSVGGAVLGGSF